MKTPHLATVTPSGYLDSCWYRLNSHNNGKGKRKSQNERNLSGTFWRFWFSTTTQIPFCLIIKASRSNDRAMPLFSVSLGREFPQAIINLETFSPIGKANWRDLQIKISTGIRIDQLAFHSKTWKVLAGRRSCPHGVPPLTHLPRCPLGW